MYNEADMVTLCVPQKCVINVIPNVYMYLCQNQALQILIFMIDKATSSPKTLFRARPRFSFELAHGPSLHRILFREIITV